MSRWFLAVFTLHFLFSVVVAACGCAADTGTMHGSATAALHADAAAASDSDAAGIDALADHGLTDERADLSDGLGPARVPAPAPLRPVPLTAARITSQFSRHPDQPLNPPRAMVAAG